MATVGQDYEPYRKRLKELGIKQTNIKQLDNTFTAQAFITTDLASNQIIAFHPGAMNYSEKNKVGDAKNVKIGMVSPDGRTGMVKHSEQFKKKKIPFIFDPGQGMPMFNGDDLRKFIEEATWVTVNDYEWELLKDRTGWSEKDITSRVDALIITLGGKGSEIHTKDKTYTIPTVVKISGIQWFNRMEEGVNRFAEETGHNAYQVGPVLFKPTMASGDQTFRTTRQGAVSYFVGGDPAYPGDHGFALKGWRAVEVRNAGILLNGDTATTMGHVTMTDKSGKRTTVDKTWTFKKDDKGQVRIVVHHSSLPFADAH